MLKFSHQPATQVLAQVLAQVLTIAILVLIVSLQSCATNGPPYAVGVKTLFIHDISRPYDAVGGVNDGVRSLITEVWYPASHATIDQDQKRAKPQFPRAQFGDYSFGQRDVHQKMMSQTTFFHLTPESVRPGVSSTQIETAINELFDRERGSFRDAPLAVQGTPFPIVVMTHGDAGSRYNMETVCEYLAAHGYVVIAPEHTGNSPFTQTGQDPALGNAYSDPRVSQKMAAIKPLLNDDGTYGDPSRYGQTYAPLASSSPKATTFIQLDQALVERVNDLRAALATLEQWNTDGEFEGRLDFNRIGVMGRSFGGMTTLAALGLENRFKAGAAVVPLVFPDVREAFASDLVDYSPRESALLNRTGDVVMNSLSKPTLLLSGAEDALIIGAGIQMQQAFGGPEPSAANPHAQLRDSYLLSSQPVYWGMLENSNHASFGVSGSYWWPHLKPDTQPRTFDPTSTFTLVDPAKAHAIQNERVLSFFDAYLKEDTEALSNLERNPHSADGFTFEARNTTK